MWQLALARAGAYLVRANGLRGSWWRCLAFGNWFMRNGDDAKVNKVGAVLRARPCKMASPLAVETCR